MPAARWSASPAMTWKVAGRASGPSFAWRRSAKPCSKTRADDRRGAVRGAVEGPHPILSMAIDHPFDHPDDPSVSVWTDEASNLSRPDPSGADQIDAEHPSRRWPIPTLWWLRPVMSAARVGEHSAVVWNRVYFSPWPATRSAVGISHGPPEALPAPNPTSSNNTSNTFGAPSGGRTGAMGAKLLSGSRAS